MAIQIQPNFIEFKDKCGLYKITINDKYYYGSSKNLYNRAYQHLPELRHNRHKNRYMQMAYNKYLDVKFNVIAICEPEHRRELEQRLLQTCIDDKNCMNLTLRTEGPSGVQWTEEARKKVSIKMKGNTNGYASRGIGRKMSTEKKEKWLESHSNKLTVIYPDNVSITYKSFKEAHTALGIPGRTMSRWLKNKKLGARLENYSIIYEGGVI